MLRMEVRHDNTPHISAVLNGGDVMGLTSAFVFALAMRCAPSVAPSTIAAVVKAESGFDPLVIGVNRPKTGPIKSLTLRDAAVTAHRLIDDGYDIDLGLAQINSRNLTRLGLSVEAAFDPCQNLAAAAHLLQTGFTLGRPERVGAQAALRIALSYYNTGRPDRGFANGYVARVTGEARRSSTRPSRSIPALAPSWSVFATTAPDQVLVFTHQSIGDVP